MGPKLKTGKGVRFIMLHAGGGRGLLKMFYLCLGLGSVIKEITMIQWIVVGLRNDLKHSLCILTSHPDLS